MAAERLNSGAAINEPRALEPLLQSNKLGVTQTQCLAMSYPGGAQEARYSAGYAANEPCRNEQSSREAPAGVDGQLPLTPGQAI